MAFNREKALTAAAKFVSKGQHDRAAKEYVAIIEADPDDTRSWLLLAEALTNAGDKPGAIERYLHVAEGYAAANDAQKAIAVYRKVLALDPNRLDIQTRIAAIYKDLGRTADAVAAYEFVAQAYFQAGLIAEGLEGFRQVAELEPAAVGKRLRLAELYSREGMVPQAVEHFRLAADRLLADRRTDDYIRVAERLIYHKEDDLPVLRSLAQIYLKQGENRRALVKLNALLRAAPADAEGLELLGETFVAIGKVDKAISVVMELAREQRKGGRKSKETAARVLRKALVWNPENAEDIRKIAAEIEAEIAMLPPDPEPGEAKPPREEGLDLDVDVVEDDVGASSTDVDIDVDIDEDEEERKVEEVPSRPFAPVGANVAPSVVEDGEESVGDVEKILLEARVYVKYKMFEHALGHLDAVFVRDANHVAALELQAQILVELGRNADAADSFVRLAQLVSSTDPKQARTHLEQAQKLVPDHTKADMVLAALDSSDSGGGGETAPLVTGMQSALRGDPTSEPVASETHASEASEPPANDEVAAVPPAETAELPPAETAEILPTETAETRTSESALSTTSEAVTPDPEASKALAALETLEPGVAKPEEIPAASTSTPSTTVVSTTAASTTAASTAAASTTAASTTVVSTTAASTTAASTASTTAASTTPEGLASRGRPQTSDGPGTESSSGRKPPTERTALSNSLPISLPISPLPRTFGEKSPLPRTLLAPRFGEGPLPSFKPPPPETVSRAASEIDGESSGNMPATATSTEETGTLVRPQPAVRGRKPGPTFVAPNPASPAGRRQPSRELEELDSGVIEELDADEVAEMVAETTKPASSRKAPPSRRGPPAKRPPPPKSGSSTPSEDSKSPAVPEDSKSQAVPEDSKSQALPEDSKSKALPEDSKSKALPEDSKSKALPEDSKPPVVPEDSKPQAVPKDSKPQAVPEDSKFKAVPADSKSPAVPADSKSKAVPEDSKSPVVPEDSKSPAVPEDSKTEPVPEDSKSQAAPKDSKSPAVPEDSKTEPVPEDSKSQVAPKDSKSPAVPPDSKAEPVPEDSKARIAPAADMIAADVSPAGERAETDALVRVEPGEGSGADRAIPDAVHQRGANAPEDGEPSEPGAGDTAMLAIDAVMAADPAWPDITDEVEELRFFISGRFEDDAQFAFLDLQRRFPGHPGLAEFADRFVTGAKLESAAAPVMLDDPRPASTPTRSASPAKLIVLDDEDTFLASIFDEPVSRAPGKSAKPRRAVASLDDGADPQTFFDLGTAYREMGLDDDALAQFDLAAKDPRWTARARIMSASLRVQRGEHTQAIDDLNLAIDFATDVDQRSEAGYELGVLYQTLGDQTSAVDALAAVAPGYRDRDERLKMLGK